MDGGGQFTSSGKRSYLSHEDDIAEHSGRQVKRKDTSSIPASIETEYRILCPSDKIGSLIVSKDSRHEENAEIHSLCPAQEALFRVHARIVEIGAVDDDEDEPPRPVIARLLVPNVQIGCVLGKGGKIIEQMRREIGAQIRVLPKEQIPAWVSSSDEMVQLSGDPALVKKALKAVSSRLYENPPRDRISGGSAEGFYMPPGPTPVVAGSGLYPSGSYVHQGGPFLTPAHMGGNVVGLGSFYGASGYGTAWSASLPSSYAVSGGHVGGTEDAVEEDLVLRVLCPNDKVGSLIGKGGSVIRKMREDTGAHIRVGDPMPDVDERVVEITSTEFADSLSSPGVEAALQVHTRLVELLSDKESCIARLLVPASQIGCILGKGGSIITEIRKATRANIRIPSKEELPKCASENDELVQITGDEGVVLDALSQVLNRLRSNLLRGGVPGQSGTNFSMPGFAYLGGPVPMAFGVRYGKGAYGGFYPAANMGYQGMSYGGFGQEQGGSVARSTKEPRRH
ncbi:hypothetical protein GOP47_0010060 [Adiantum capillus-veneris]|uniref:K Homology domain-containing protein n=1 Tax=Adiantum capillus-veneris TaxID=13818 RepID=A0A9D4UUK1_ADICA|nr:hypothetical protein GOP47_0010060 [Adiantum capillus-veneris]